MRRPLFMVCLGSIILLTIYFQFVPVSFASYPEAEGQKLILSGNVTRKECKSSDYGVSLLLTVSNIDNLTKGDLGELVFTRQLLCYFPGDTLMPEIGSQILLEGTFRGFEEASNPGQFDERLYYAIQKIQGSMRSSSLLGVVNDTGLGNIRETLWRLRTALAKKADTYMDATDAGIFKTMLLGEKGSLEEEIKLKYKRSGLIHILSISGLHISIIGLGLYKLLRKAGMPIYSTSIICMLLMTGYGIMTGMPVSALRAVGMFLLRMLSEILGRTYDLQTALGILAVSILVENPFYLFHSGFLLSFGSVLAVSVVLPVIKGGKGNTPLGSRLRQLGTRGGKLCGLSGTIVDKLWEGLTAGIAILVMTLPIHYWFYYEISVYSLLFNLFVIPLMSVLLPVALLFFLTPASLSIMLKLLVYPCHLMLQLIDGICGLSDQLPGNVLILGKPLKWQVIGYLILLALFLWKGVRIKGGYRALWLIAMVFLLTIRFRPECQVTFLDVGQGDCICIQLQDQSAYLVDGGSSSEGQVGKYRISPYLKSQGISELKAVFITHPDEDHTNGIVELLQMMPKGGVKIANLVLPDIAKESRTEAYLELVQMAQAYHVPVSYIGRGQELQDGKLELNCLHPYKDYNAKEANAYSTVLRVTYDESTFLLTGDVEQEGEKDLIEYLRKYPQPAFDVLKIAHHGSNSSSSEEILKLLEAPLGIISCGHQNPYGHPHIEVLGRMEEQEMKWLRTDERGAITIRTDGEKMWVVCFK